MANPLIIPKTKSPSFSEGSRDIGITDDYVVRKDMQTREGSIEKVPVKNNDIVNKEYCDKQISKVTDNLVLTNFRLQMALGLAYGLFEDGWIDEFEDETGIDTTSSVNQVYDSTDDYYSPLNVLSVPTPTLHYKMNDNLGTTDVVDNINSYNGTAQRNTSTITQTGKINQSLTFNGSSDYIYYASAVTGKTRSMAFWVYVNSSVAGQRDIINESSLARVQIADGLLYVESGTFSTDISLSADTWTHVVIIYDAVNEIGKIYINGVLHGTKNPFSSATMSSPTFLSLGRYETGGLFYMDGSLDDVRIYNRVLNETEITTIYNGGTGTEEDSGTGGVQDMTLFSNAQTALSIPSSTRITILEEDVDSITLNTDLKAYVSIDGGSNYSQINLEDKGDFDTSKRILAGEVAITTNTGTIVQWKLLTDNNKELKIHGVGLLWR